MAMYRFVGLMASIFILIATLTYVLCYGAYDPRDISSDVSSIQEAGPISAKASLLYKSKQRWTQNDYGSNYNQPHHQSGSPMDRVDKEPLHLEEYTCGRAVASKKHDKSLLERDLGQGSMNGPMRTKYRPFEIRTPRIIGGDETIPGEFPWAVSVKLNGQPICGGSLINKRWILTAAHCVVGYNPKNLTVRLGAYRIKDSSEHQTVDSTISLFIVHKQYSMPRPFSNDIALLKMSEQIKYSDYIIPICLPTEDQISTTLINEIVTDYSQSVTKQLLTDINDSPASTLGPSTFGATAGAPEDFDTSEGIVVSTKMSDKEISRCFKRLEQNYLNSIGLGSSMSPSSPVVAFEAEPTSGGDVKIETEHQANSGSSDNKHNYPMAPIPLDLMPVLSESENDKTNGNELVDGVSPLHVLSETADGQSSESSTGTNNHRVTFAQLVNDPIDTSAPHTSHHPGRLHQQQQQQAPLFAAVTNNQHQVNNHRNNHRQLVSITYEPLHTVSNQHKQQINQVHYNSLWNKRSAHATNSEQAKSIESVRTGPTMPIAAGDPKAIKLTSLPISKELLREIQSVGSMQSLNLGFHQGDIAAMTNNMDSSNLLVPQGYAADRERVMSNPPSTHAAPIRQIVRDSDLINAISELDESNSKHSGVSGIVVGWGWVRENDIDNEQQQQQQQQQQVDGGQRSYQSVTLQKVRLPILRNNDCEAWFKSQEKKITLLPSQFCAGFNSGGKDACRGDSGGPMIIEDNTDTGRFKLIGIVSAGIGCARPSLPGLYTRVASFLPWIHAQIIHN